MPLLTYLDDATGERTELTAAELGGWAAATAALLTDGCRLGPGSRATIRLPPHWQTAADRVLIPADRSEQPVQWLLAPLSAGAAVILAANLDPSRVADLAAAESATRVL